MQAATLLRNFQSHGLCLHDSLVGQSYLHTAVKQHAAATADAALLRTAQQAFVQHMAGQLAAWTAMYGSPAHAVTLSMLRMNCANLEQASCGRRKHWISLTHFPALIMH
jgi:hypothetical protein